jgi:hypothetical protein
MADRSEFHPIFPDYCIFRGSPLYKLCLGAQLTHHETENAKSGALSFKPGSVR